LLLFILKLNEETKINMLKLNEKESLKIDVEAKDNNVIIKINNFLSVLNLNKLNPLIVFNYKINMVSTEK